MLLLVITDGRRDCITQTVPSALEMLQGERLYPRFIFDDSGDPDHHRWLERRFGPAGFEVFWEPERQGFGGAIRAAWRILNRTAELDEARHVAHLEDDFTFNRPVPLPRLVKVLDTLPNLVQMALRRQPWNDHERAAGGIVEQHPDAYEDHSAGPGYDWLEHRLFFTTNPCVYRRSLCWQDWPEGANSEGRFTHQLLRDGLGDIPGDCIRFGYWGQRTDEPWVTHIGHERAGTGY